MASLILCVTVLHASRVLGSEDHRNRFCGQVFVGLPHSRRANFGRFCELSVELMGFVCLRGSRSDG